MKRKTAARDASIGVVRGDVERTQILVLNAARSEFASQGFSGARIETIAARAGVNKQALYYHFSNKEGLYRAVLEDGYRLIRDGQIEIAPEGGTPTEAMRKLVEAFFDNVIKFRDIVDVVADENRHKGRHLKGATLIREVNKPFVLQVKNILERGVSDGSFRANMDPIQLWISIVSLAQFYLGNSYTLSHILARQVDNPDSIRERRAHVVDLILSALKAG